MIELRKYNRKVKMPDADYVLDKFEEFEPILVNLTPKFTGRWLIILLDVKITEAKSILENEMLPEFLDILILLPQAKLDKVLLEFPKFQQKQLSNKDMFKELVAGLNHPMDTNAMWSLYETLNGNIPRLTEALQKLDKECESTTITLKQVKTSFGIQNVVYASQVIEAFLTRSKHRWYLFNKLLHELGEEYAYYALYKHVRRLLTDKAKYLVNEDVKNFSIAKIDAPFICYAYMLFSNSSSPCNVHSIMWCLDNRSSDIEVLLKEDYRDE